MRTHLHASVTRRAKKSCRVTPTSHALHVVFCTLHRVQRLSADKPSLGVFELGGASMQVTFALTEPSDAAEV